MCAKCEVRAIQCFTSVHSTEKHSPHFRVILMVDLVDPNNGENIAGKRGNLGINAGDAAAVNVEFMFPPPTALWKGIADGRTILPEFTLANTMNYFVTRKVCDGEIAGDFKHVNNHSYRLLHIQLDVIIFETVLCQFSICSFCEYI